MVIDLILDALEDEKQNYNPNKFYHECMEYQENFSDIQAIKNITLALDYGTNNDIRRALCQYIDGQGYNPNIKKRINRFYWL